MNKRWLLSLLVLVALPLFGMTGEEQAIVHTVRDQIRMAKIQFNNALAQIAISDGRASVAEGQVKYLLESLRVLDLEIKDHVDNERKLADEVENMRPIYKLATSWYGIGAIVLGVGLLVKHLFILAIALLGLALLLWLLSTLGVPGLGFVTRIGGNLIGRVFRHGP